MATIWKSRSKKALAAGPIQSIGYANYVIPGMPAKPHITFTLRGDETHIVTVRLTFAEVRAIQLQYERMFAEGLIDG